MAYYYHWIMQTKFDIMKQVGNREVTKGKQTRMFHLNTAFYMVLVFIFFWAISFYVLLNSLA